MGLLRRRRAVGAAAFLGFAAAFGFLLLVLREAVLPEPPLPAGVEPRAPARHAPSDEQIAALLMEAEAENAERLQRLQEVCSKHNLGLYRHSAAVPDVKEPPTPQYGVFYIDKIHKLAWCPIYKAASTTWLHHLCVLAGLSEESLAADKRQISDIARALYPELDYLEAEEALQRSLKLVVVRHPFARLLSAYRDKLENSEAGREHGSLHFYRRYGQRIVARYRPGGNSTHTLALLRPDQRLPQPDQPPPAGIEPTFQEFVRYLIDTDLTLYADDHWIPYHLFCTPCLLKYDVVAKVETLERDQWYVLSSAGVLDIVQPKWLHRTNKKGSEVQRIYFSQLDTDLLNGLYEKYKIDFELFGYTPDEYYKYVSS